MIPALIVPVLTRPDLLHRMLDSIDYPVSDLVIIDNGHVVPGRQVVENVQRTHVVTMPTNLGVPASWNLGVKCLPHAPWWLICNFDIVFPSGSLERLAAVQSGGVVLSAASPPWACFALHDEAVQQVGLFDEGLYPAYFEDCDYERRLRAAGVPIVKIGRAHV
jgi:GT2 family glycosyltransferase